MFTLVRQLAVETPGTRRCQMVSECQYETKIDRVIATVCRGVAKIPETRSTRELAAGREAGTAGGYPGTGDAGAGPDSPRAEALAHLKISNHQNVLLKQAQIFFAEASIPTEETHRAARQSEIDLNRLNATLSRRTMELAVTNRQLQRGVIRRKIMEDAFKKNGQHHTKCLGESLQLQKHLRQLTHRVLAAQEDERTQLSLKLQNDIAQTLLGINVRLVALKRDARSNMNGFKKNIANAQQLVVKTVQSVRRFARKLETREPE